MLEQSKTVLMSLEDCFNADATLGANVYHMGEWFLSNHRLLTQSTRPDALIWCYDVVAGIYTVDFADIIRQEIARVSKDQWSIHLSNRTIQYVQAKAYDPDVILGGARNEVVLLNGVYDTEDDEFLGFNPDMYHITALPVAYRPSATCPKILEFLEQVVPDEQDRDALIEYLGYCLVHSYHLNDLIILVGSGANGKSTWFDVVTAFLGRENVTGHTLQGLAHGRFTISKLRGKLANICADIPSTRLKDTGIIKTLTGGDIINADEKYRPSFEFTNNAKLWFSCNAVPAASDESDAFHRRARIIEFPNQFSEGAEGTKNRNDLIDTLTTPEELGGLLNLAIEGYRRYNERGVLSGTKSVEEKKRDYTKRSDPIQFFCDEYISQELEYPENFIEHATIYRAYCLMCEKMRRRPTSDNWFAKSMQRFVTYAQKDKHPDQDKRTIIWRGAKFDYSGFCEEWEVYF